MHRPPKEIRTVRYAFNPHLTSQLPPSAIFQDVHRVLLLLKSQNDGNLKFERSAEGYYYLKCELTGMGPDDVQFEIEVCRIWLLKMHGVRIKRISGSALSFKFIYSKMCELLLL
ncbi:KA1 domain/Ssp2 C-terminal domain-containing protein [Zopfochytrium polystomum]|nr:KA1 domain/Ssp2 C-terminal domain-containing protein [Zopfochytrium polystomum]